MANARVRGLESASDLVPVTPADGVDLPGGTCRAFWVETAGALHVVTAAGEERTYPAAVFSAGMSHSLRLTKVYDTGTDAVIWVAY